MADAFCRLGDLESRAFASSVKDWWFEPRSCQIKN